MRLIILLAILLTYTSSTGQIRIDSVFSFQTDPAKKYSLYIPGTYDAATPNRLMLGLHPFNTARWDAESWCDTLIVFAETNGLIMVCPDGGTDGKVDDDIDTAFTSALLDSMKVWYNIDTVKTYVMGFSWGGQTTYTYGLRHISKFGGMLPIGSAMSGTSMVSSVLNNADSVPVYIVHGGNDTPSSRYTPIRDALISNGAILNSILISGVGHTIDFPNRNQILTSAFQWIDSVNCSLPAPPDTAIPTDPTSIISISASSGISLFPNPSSGVITLALGEVVQGDYSVTIFNVLGQRVFSKDIKISQGQRQLHLSPSDLSAGSYLINLEGTSYHWSDNFILKK
ncbi:MAG: T9SS type A sorting domain-containing protein [Flavobacteriales bacterium]|nr:T9SS type A sorting domain-containing protein [Flavobacteriales bacterium]